jgi:hypothetical protein
MTTSETSKTKYIVETLVSYVRIVEAESDYEAEMMGYDWREAPEDDGVYEIKVSRLVE